jgi:hypothetical protein
MMTEQPTSPATTTPSTSGRAFTLAAVALGLLVWPIGFNLGAFDAVFFEQVFQIVVVTTVALLAAFVVPRDGTRRRWPVRLVLAGPILWLAVAGLVTDSVADAATDPVLGPLGFVVSIVSIPYGLYLLGAYLAPDTRHVRGIRPVAGLVITVLLIGFAGYYVGRNNHRFLTCQDFKVSGNDLPENCAPP